MSLISQLSQLIESKDFLTVSKNEIEHIFLQLITQLSEDEDNLDKELVKDGLLPLLNSVLEKCQEESTEAATHDRNNQLISLALKLIAELAKNETNRPELVIQRALEHSVKALTTHVASGLCEINLQSLRAIGNACFENDAARSEVNKHSGPKAIVDMLQHISTAVKSSQSEDLSNLIIFGRTCCGCILNVALDNPELQLAFIENNVVSHLLSISTIFLTKSSAVVSAAHKALFSIIEKDVGRKAFVEANGIEILVNDLIISKDEDVSRMIVDTLEIIIEEESQRKHFARNNLVGKLITFVNEQKNGVDDSLPDTDPKIRVETLSGTVAKIVSAALTDDECMLPLFDPSNGGVLLDFLNWLSVPDVTVRMAGALCIGNFARRDDHCIRLMDLNVSEPILKLLDAEDAREQHAALGALKNLSMPADNKERMLSPLLLSKLLDLMNSPHAQLQFLSSSTLRSLCNGNKTNCEIVAGRDDILRRAVDLMTSENVGTKCECARLFGYIAKQSKTPDELSKLTAVSGTIQAIAFLLTTEHSLLHMEAIVSLTLAVAMCSSLTSILAESEGALLKISMEGDSPQLKSNAIRLLGLCFSIGPAKEAKLQPDTAAKIKNIAQDISLDPMVQEAARSTLEKLNL